MTPRALIAIAGDGFLADPAGALFHEGERLLVVADLHLEKGSSLARRGMMLPPFDTAATLARLARVALRLRPRAVIALGDSFHDRSAAGRLGAEARGALAALQAGRDWLWIAGNHDPDPPRDLGGEAHAEWRLGGLTLRHEPAVALASGEGEIAGHLHPAARIVGRGGSVRRPCFVTDGRRCVMPAFGAYAGGLDVSDEAFAPLFGPRAVVAHVLGRERIWRVPLTPGRRAFPGVRSNTA